jgi:hypothetical protein
VLNNVEPEVILGPNKRVHVVVATQEPLSDPGSWEPFPHEGDITIMGLLDELPENDINLKELVEKWGFPKPEFFVVDVRLEDFKQEQLHQIADKMDDLRIVRDAICEAVVLTMPEHETMRHRIDELYRQPRYYIVVADELSQNQVTAITNLMADGCKCEKCYRKHELEKRLQVLWLAASTAIKSLHRDTSGQIIRS